jgi:hypothetical protein
MGKRLSARVINSRGLPGIVCVPRLFQRKKQPNVGGVSAFSNAVNDVFAHLGLTHTQMPHDHWRVWKTVQHLGLTAD